MQTIKATNGTRVVLGSNAAPSALHEGPETSRTFALALDDALAAGGRCRFVANGTHYSINQLNEVNAERVTPFTAPKWNPKGTAVTWADEDGGIPAATGTATGIYMISGPFESGATYYQVTRDDGQEYWVTNPTRRH